MITPRYTTDLTPTPATLPGVAVILCDAVASTLLSLPRIQVTFFKAHPIQRPGEKIFRVPVFTKNWINNPEQEQ
jgi:hypothetical protein